MEQMDLNGDLNSVYNASSFMNPSRIQNTASRPYARSSTTSNVPKVRITSTQKPDSLNPDRFRATVTAIDPAKFNLKINENDVEVHKHHQVRCRKVNVY